MNEMTQKFCGLHAKHDDFHKINKSPKLAAYCCLAKGDRPLIFIVYFKELIAFQAIELTTTGYEQ
jgi:hypothetical protein